MSLVIAKWTIAEYHRMIEAGILSDRHFVAFTLIVKIILF